MQLFCDFGQESNLPFSLFVGGEIVSGLRGKKASSMYACRRGIKLGPVMAVVGTIGTDISDKKEEKREREGGIQRWTMKIDNYRGIKSSCVWRRAIEKYIRGELWLFLVYSRGCIKSFSWWEWSSTPDEDNTPGQQVYNSQRLYNTISYYYYYSLFLLYVWLVC